MGDHLILDDVTMLSVQKICENSLDLDEDFDIDELKKLRVDYDAAISLRMHYHQRRIRKNAGRVRAEMPHYAFLWEAGGDIILLSKKAK